MPSVAVTTQFLEAFRRLPNGIQRKTIAFVEKFQADPRSPGINYETIQGVRDRKLRSGRVDQTYRAIVVQPSRGEVYRLVWVDRHDEAYAWARVRVFNESPDGARCQLIVENATELERRIEGQAGIIIGQEIFAGFSDEDLHSLGVPADLILLIRQIRSPEVLSSLRGLVADHVLFGLECLVNGDELADVRSVVEAEEKRLLAGAVTMLGSLQEPADTGQVETVSLRHGLREFLERLMAATQLTGEPTYQRSPPTPAEGDSKSRDAGGAYTGGEVGAIGPAIPDPDGLEDRIERYRRELLTHVERQFRGLEPVGLECEESDKTSRGRNTNLGLTVDLLTERLRKRESVCLYSGGGSGKTTTLRLLARQWASSYEPHTVVRVLAYLDGYTHNHKDLLEFLADPLAFPEDLRQHLLREDLLALARASRIELLLDGADEIQRSTQKDLLYHIELFHREHKTIPVILGTRRPMTRSDLFPRCVRIRPMSEPAQNEFAQARLQDVQSSRTFLQALRETPGGRQVVESPICLSIACEIAQARGTGIAAAVEGQARLYRSFFEHLHARESEPPKRRSSLPGPEQLRVVLGGLFLECMERGTAPKLLEAVSTLRDVCGDAASEVVQVLQEWPLFKGGVGNSSLDVFHSSFAEYLIAEYLLGRPVESPRLFKVIQHEQTFVLACVFQLADPEFFESHQGPAWEFVKASWTWDPLFVVFSLPVDALLPRFVVPASLGPWWRGVLRTLKGETDVSTETEEITERQLSFPPNNLVERLTDRALWRAGLFTKLSYKRLDRLFGLFQETPEPWADLLSFCCQSCPEWYDRVCDLATNDPDEHTIAVFGALACLAGVARPNLFPFSKGREGGPTPDELIPDLWRQVPFRLLLACMVRWISDDDEISFWDGSRLFQSVAETEIAREQPRFWDVLWLLQSQRLWQTHDGYPAPSRRQWNLIWRWWDNEVLRKHICHSIGYTDEELKENGFAPYPAVIRLPVSNSDGLDPVAPTAVRSPNIAAAVARFGWAHPEQFTEEQVRNWKETATFLETRALVRANILSLTPEDWDAGVPRWTHQVASFDDAIESCVIQDGWTEIPVSIDDSFEFVGSWFPRRRFPWDRLNKSTREQLLARMYRRDCKYRLQEWLFAKGLVTWDLLPLHTRDMLAEACAFELTKSTAELPDEQGCLIINSAGSARKYTGYLLSAIGEGLLTWRALREAELRLLVLPETENSIQRAVKKGTLRLDTLAKAPEELTKLDHIRAALADADQLHREMWGRSKDMLKLQELVENRPISGGLSGITEPVVQMSDDSMLNDLLDSWEEQLARNPRSNVDQFVADHCASHSPDVVDAFRRNALALVAIDQRLSAIGDCDVNALASSGETGPATQLELSDLRTDFEPIPGYRLVAFLDSGGFGHVWRALGPGGFEVALKFVPLDRYAGQAEERSLELVKHLRHPHLLATFGSWWNGNLLIIASELADRTMRDRLDEVTKQGKPGIPRDELLGYFDEAAEAIDYLNQPAGPSPHRIQHRDIKPENLFLSAGHVKVGDLGLARSVVHSATGHTGSMTIAYAAPEFIEGKTSGRSDQYSLAVTYCFLRSSRLPFEGNHAQIIAGHLHKPPNLSMLPVGERPAVERAMSKAPKDRWPSCAEFVQALAASDATTRKPENIQSGQPVESKKDRGQINLDPTTCLVFVSLATIVGAFFVSKIENESSRGAVLAVLMTLMFLAFAAVVAKVRKSGLLIGATKEKRKEKILLALRQNEIDVEEANTLLKQNETSDVTADERKKSILLALSHRQITTEEADILLMQNETRD